MGGDEVGNALEFTVIRLSAYNFPIVSDAEKKPTAFRVGEGRQILQSPIGPLPFELQGLAFPSLNLPHALCPLAFQPQNFQHLVQAALRLGPFFFRLAQEHHSLLQG